MHGTGEDPQLWKLHREEVAREVRAGRRPVRSGETPCEPGRLAAFWRELGVDAVRFFRIFGLARETRKRKGAA